MIKETMDEQTFVYKSPIHTESLNKMRLNNKWCDVTIKVNKKEFHAHKVILAANLNYFESMLSNDSFQESKDGIVTMESIDGTYFEALITYAYTGEILLTASNALSLLELANYLGEIGIKNACINFLEKHLKQEYVLRAFVFASVIDCVSLKNVAKWKVLADFDTFSQETNYLDLDYDSLMEILSDSKARLLKPQQIFEGTMRWVMYDVEDRKQHFNDLLGSINFIKLSADYLLEYLYKNVIDRNETYAVIRDSVMYSYHINQMEQKKKEKVLMVVGDISRKFHFQSYSFTKKKWSFAQEIPEVDGNNYSNGTILNEELYYISLHEGRYTLQRFNPMTKKSTAIKCSKTILKWSTLCACNRYLYLCGGLKENDSGSDQVLKYDPLTGTFETLPPMRTKRNYTTAVFYQGYLHVLGGHDGSSILNSVEKYDSITKKWMSFPSMCDTRYGFGATVLDDKLYACGGDETYKSVEVYDPEKNSWQRIASMNKSRIHLLMFTHEGKLVAMKGNNENTAEVYDPNEDQWQINQQIFSGLQVNYPRGGLILANYLDGCS